MRGMKQNTRDTDKVLAKDDEPCQLPHTSSLCAKKQVERLHWIPSLHSWVRYLHKAYKMEYIIYSEHAVRGRTRRDPGVICVHIEVQCSPQV